MKVTFTLLCLLGLTVGITAPSTLAGNRVLSLDGFGDYVEIPHHDSISPDKQVTVETWVKPAIFTFHQSLVFKKNDGPEFGKPFFEEYGLFLSGDKARYILGKSSITNASAWSSPLSIEQWVHLAGTYDGSELRLYVNGILQAATPWAFGTENSSNPLTLGRAYGGTASYTENYFQGELDEVRIWNIARTPEEIKATMNITLTGDEDGLVGYWNFDDGTANDLTANGNDGTLLGDAQIVVASLPEEFVFEPISAPKERKILLYEHRPREAQDYWVVSQIGPVAGPEIMCVQTDTLSDNRLDDYDILWLSWCSVSANYEYMLTPEDEEAIKRYVENGGFVWASANDNNGFQTGWLPYPIELVDSGDYPVEVTEATGRLFTKPHIVDADQVVWDEYFVNFDTAHYEVLVHRQDIPDAAALVRAKYGNGMYLLGCVDTRSVESVNSMAVRTGTFAPLFENVIAAFMTGKPIIAVVNIDDKIANPGEQFTTSISVRSADNLHSFNFDLIFDPSVLKVRSVKEGPFLVGTADEPDAIKWQPPAIEEGTGGIRNISCSRISDAGISGNGVLAIVTFEAVDIGVTDLHIQNLRLLSPTGEEIIASTQGGKIKAYPHGSISGVVLDAASEKPIKGARVEVSKDNFNFGVWTHSAEDGTYTLSEVPCGDFAVTASKDDYMAETISKVRVEQGKNTPDINLKITSFATAQTITISTPIAVGETAPDFTLKDINGKEVSLSSFAGKSIILNFWDSTSEHCRCQIAHLNALHRKYQENGLVVIGITRGKADNAAVSEFSKLEISYILLSDGAEIFQHYGVTGVPCTYYVDKAGKVRYRDVGFSAGGEAKMEENIKELLAKM